jgi:hypothetical protein
MAAGSACNRLARHLHKRNIKAYLLCDAPYGLTVNNFTFCHTGFMYFIYIICLVYDIFKCNCVAAVQYTFTQQQYTEQHYTEHTERNIHNNKNT